jgi:hypothetical protein
MDWKIRDNGVTEIEIIQAEPDWEIIFKFPVDKYESIKINQEESKTDLLEPGNLIRLTGNKNIISLK